MKKIIKRYGFMFLCLAALLLIFVVSPERGRKGLGVTIGSLKEMLLILPPIFTLLGILDVWVSKEAMTKRMGPGSGIRGAALAFLIGSAAAGPLYGAFPVAAVFIRKGVSLFNVYVFLGAWSTTKIPMFLFELSNLGARFAVTRLLVDIPGILLIAFILTRAIGEKDSREIERIVESREY